MRSTNCWEMRLVTDGRFGGSLGTGIAGGMGGNVVLGGVTATVGATTGIAGGGWTEDEHPHTTVTSEANVRLRHKPIRGWFPMPEPNDEIDIVRLTTEFAKTSHALTAMMLRVQRHLRQPLGYGYRTGRIRKPRNDNHSLAGRTIERVRVSDHRLVARGRVAEEFVERLQRTIVRPYGLSCRQHPLKPTSNLEHVRGAASQLIVIANGRAAPRLEELRIRPRRVLE
jgi:hypothetical protein